MRRLNPCKPHHRRCTRRPRARPGANHNTPSSCHGAVMPRVADLASGARPNSTSCSICCRRSSCARACSACRSIRPATSPAYSSRSRALVSWLLRSHGSAVARQDARRHHRPRDRRERQHDPLGKARGDLEHNPCRTQGTARNADPETGWAEHRGKRTILVNAGRHDAAFKLLDVGSRDRRVPVQSAIASELTKKDDDWASVRTALRRRSVSITVTEFRSMDAPAYGPSSSC